MTTARLLAAGLILLATAPARAARAQTLPTFSFTFGGPGVRGTVALTYGPATDAKYPNAFRVTGVSGWITDTNNGLDIVEAPIGALVPITQSAPDTSNKLAPKDFSRFAVASGLPVEANGNISYDNLFWPGGSPQTATDYPGAGGFLDIYGLLFSIGGGRVVNIWSNGALGPTPVNYGVAVVTSAAALDYVGGGVSASAVPEPGSFALLAVGGAGLALVRVRRRASR